MDQQGINIHLLDFRVVDDHVGKALHEFFKYLGVRDRSSPESCKQFIPLDAPNHSPCVVPAYGGETKRHILEHFHKYAAEPEHEQGPENRITVHAQNHFIARGSHFLDQHPVNYRIRVKLFRSFNDILEGVFYIFPVFKSHDNPACVGFVKNLG